MRRAKSRHEPRRPGARFSNDSVLVFDVLEAREGEGTTSEGTRRHIDVMEKMTSALPQLAAGDSRNSRATVGQEGY
jgi:hypothetical protein